MDREKKSITVQYSFRSALKSSEDHLGQFGRDAAVAAVAARTDFAPGVEPQWGCPSEALDCVGASCDGKLGQGALFAVGAAWERRIAVPEVDDDVVAGDALGYCEGFGGGLLLRSSRTTAERESMIKLMHWQEP